MDPHAMSKFANSAVKPPVFSGTSTWKTYHERDNAENTSSGGLSQGRETYSPIQTEPSNFTKMSSMEKDGLKAFDVNRHTLTADFYKRLQELKKEHGKTMELLSQLYTSESSRCHSQLSHSDSTKQKMLENERLTHRYNLDRTNNSMLHINSDKTDDDIIPGYRAKDVRFRQEMREKRDREKTDYDSDISDDEKKSARTDDIVHEMWKDFSLQDYMRKNRDNLRPRKFKTKERPASAPPKKTEWSPVITIPKPFSMTLREEQKREKGHTRSSMEISRREREREESIAREMSTKIRAREPPAHIYLPLYEEIQERREQRYRFNKENSIATTLALQKPFSFAERDEMKIKMKKQQQLEAEKKEARKIKKMTKFEAHDVPYSIHDPSISERLKEEDLYRKIKSKLRSEDLYRKSALPPRMQAHELMAQHRRQKWQEDVERDTAYSFKPRTHEMPDFEALHKQEEMEAFNRKMEVETTAVKPFNLRTSVRTKGDITSESLDGMDEPKWSTPRFKATKPLVQSDTIPARMTDTTRRRLEIMKQSLEKAEKELQETKELERQRVERRKQMAHIVQKKTTGLDNSALLSASQEEKLKRHRRETRKRDAAYGQFLEEVKTRVKERPLLFEQHNEKMAKIQAEKRYREILETSGISDDFMDRKTRFSTSSASPPFSPRQLTRDSYDSEQFEQSSDEEQVVISNRQPAGLQSHTDSSEIGVEITNKEVDQKQVEIA